MEFRITVVRVAVFAALLVLFYFLGGFANPATLDPEGIFHTARLNRSWFYMIVMFIIGAGCVCFIEHTIGVVAPVSLKFLYVVIGAGLMIGAVMWGNTVRDSIVTALG